MAAKRNLISAFVLVTSLCLSLIISPAASSFVFQLVEPRRADHWCQLGNMCWIRVPESHMRSADMADNYCRNVKRRMILLRSMALCFNTDGWRDKDHGLFQKRVMGNNGM
ncbi:hypothetical protein ACOMHN_046974 [Nucella lapillus]